MTKLLRAFLILTGIFAPITGLALVITAFTTQRLAGFDGPLAWGIYSISTHFLEMFQQFALGGICLFAAHTIQPFGGKK